MYLLLFFHLKRPILSRMRQTIIRFKRDLSPKRKMKDENGQKQMLVLNIF